MNYRTKVLWLPALCALAISSGLLDLFQHAGLVPRFYWLSGEPGTYHAYFAFYVPWLIALPVIGAVAAFWSQRAGGKTLHRLVAALAPPLGTLVMLVMIPVVTPLIYLHVSLIHHKVLPNHFSLSTLLAGFLILFANWVLLPAIALFIGAVPFLRKPHPQG